MGDPEQGKGTEQPLDQKQVEGYCKALSSQGTPQIEVLIDHAPVLEPELAKAARRILDERQ